MFTKGAMNLMYGTFDEIITLFLSVMDVILPLLFKFYQNLSWGDIENLQSLY